MLCTAFAAALHFNRSAAYAEGEEAPQGIVLPEGVDPANGLVWQEHALGAADYYPQFTYAKAVYGNQVYVTVIAKSPQGSLSTLYTFALVYGSGDDYNAYAAITSGNLSIIQEYGGYKKFQPEGISGDGKGLFFNLLNSFDKGEYILRFQTPDIRGEGGVTIHTTYKAEYAVTVTAEYDIAAESVNALRIVTQNGGQSALPVNSAGNAEIAFSYGFSEKVLRTLRPEHGDTVFLRVITPAADDSTKIGKEEFKVALKFNESGEYTAYNFTVTGGGENVISDGAVYALGEKMSDKDYLRTALNALSSGEYVMVSHTEAFSRVLHPHWWTGESYLYDSGCGETDKLIDIKVSKYDFSQVSGKISYSLSQNKFTYSGNENKPVPAINYNGKVIPDSLYTLSYQNNVDASVNSAGNPLPGKTSSAAKPAVIITPLPDSDFTGEYRIIFEIVQAELSFTKQPEISGWVYGNFDQSISAEVSAGGAALPADTIRYAIYRKDTHYPYNNIYVKFTVDGEKLEYFRLNADGSLPEYVLRTLNTLGAGTYYIKASCNYSGYEFFNVNYRSATSEDKQFVITSAQNSWVKQPAIEGWQYGAYSEAINAIVAEAQFCNENLSVTVKGKDNGTVYYSAVGGEVTGDLASLGAGEYILTCEVVGTANYSELSGSAEFTVTAAQNSWIKQPAITGWQYGSYSATKNAVVAEAKFGSDGLTVTVKNKDGEVCYRSVGGKVETGDLSTLVAGSYVLTCEVAESESYSGLNASVDFTVAPKKKSGCRSAANGMAGGVSLAIVAAAISISALRRKNADK